jgi:uncharacterized membrane protein (DUF4010 family)
MEVHELFLSLALALGVGLLLGFEREQAVVERANRLTFLGGARTYPLVSMLGAVSMLLSRALGVWIILVPFLGVVSFLLVGYADDVRRDRGRGVTSEIAFLLAFTLGALSIAVDVIEPIGRRAVVIGSIAVCATGLLSLKTEIRTFVSRVSRRDVFAALKFLFVAVILLPELPDIGTGPHGLLNPQKIGLVVTFIVGVSFAGYLAVRLLGPSRGIGVTGFLGGLVSSTAVTVSMARNARSEPSIAITCASAVQLASGVTFLRVLVEVWVINPALILHAAPPLIAMLVASLVIAWVQLRYSHKHPAIEEELDLANPVELLPALKMTAIFTAVIIVTGLSTEYLGHSATLATGFLAGATNVDAITISMAKLAQVDVSGNLAIATILVGTASNTLLKVALAFFFGGRPFGRHVLWPSLLMLALGGIVWLAIRLS